MLADTWQKDINLADNRHGYRVGSRGDRRVRRVEGGEGCGHAGQQWLAVEPAGLLGRLRQVFLGIY